MKTNIPKLRFVEFKDDPAWEEKKFGDVGSFKKGKGISKSDIAYDGVNECIRYGELYTTYGNLIETVYSRTNCSKDKMVLSTGKEIIIPSSGEAIDDISTASAVLRKDVILGGDLNVVELVEHNNIYFSYLLKYKQKNNVAKLAQGISVIHLYNEQLKTLKLNVPRIKEQDKIGEFLSTLDKRIELQEKLIEKLEEEKKGYLQKLFPKKGMNIPELRFEEFKTSAEWEEKYFFDVTTKSNIKNKDKNVKYVESISNKRGFTAQSEQFDGREIASKDTSNYYVVDKGCFAYNPSRIDVGSIALKSDSTISIISPLYEVFRTNLCELFLYEWIKSNYFACKINSLYEGGVRNTLTYSNLSTIKVMIPIKDEQKMISNYLSIVNSIIVKEMEELEKLRLLKIYNIDSCLC